MSDEAQPSPTRELLLGMAQAFGLTVLCAGILPLLLLGIIGSIGGFDALTALLAALPMLVGVTQLLWLVPLYRRFSRAGKGARNKGVLLAGALTLLLNGACWGTFALTQIDFK